MSADSTRLTGTPALLLATGVVVLEFGTAVSTFVAGSLLPVIERELDAARLLPLLVSGATLGLFVALPLAPRLVSHRRAPLVLAVGLAAAVGGTTLSALARGPWVFAAGQVVAGCAGGVLAVFGIAAAIRHLDDALRIKVVAAMSAMWILPALVGPAVTLAVESWVGWRWALLLPVPFVVAGRMLVVRSAPGLPPPEPAERPVGRALLIPVGVAGLVLLGATPWWPLAPLAAAVALVGFVALVPRGYTAVERGAPAGLVGLTLFGFGYFGANSLVTLLASGPYGADLGQAGAVLGSSSVAWGVATVVMTRVRTHGLPPALGLSVTAGCVALVGALAPLGPPWTVLLALWTLTGVGVGLAYPALYLRATTVGPGLPAAALATAAITTESFGLLLGTSVASGLVGLAASAPGGRTTAFTVVYLLSAVVLALAALAAHRSARVPQGTMA